MFESRKLRSCSIHILEVCSAETSRDSTPLSLMGASFFSILFCCVCCLKETKAIQRIQDGKFQVWILFPVLISA